MLERLTSAPRQSFPETRTPRVGALVLVKTGGVAQQWRVRNIKITSGIWVTMKFENSEMTVDESWLVFDANSGCLFLENEPQHICIKWVCMKAEPVWGNEVVNDKLSTALDTCFSG